MTQSAWGVEHGAPITKSLVGQNKFVPAVKLGAKRLRAAREKMTTDRRYRSGATNEQRERMRAKVENAPKGKDMSYPKEAFNSRDAAKYKKRGVYAPRGDARTDAVVDAGRQGRHVFLKLKQASDPSKKTTFVRDGKRYPVHVIPGYSNAHPQRFGSRKGGQTVIYAGDTFLKGKDSKKILRHEVMHGEGKSSWRQAQINSRRRAQMREEARVDTLSGTYKINTVKEALTGGAGLSHTAANRITPGRGEREFRRVQDSMFRGRGQSPKAESKLSGAGYSRTYGRPNSSRAERAGRYAVAGSAAGGAGGGAAYGNYQLKGKQRRASNGKFA